jgi:hypothetical protein
LRSAGAFGEQKVQAVFHLRLASVQRQDALVKDHRPLRPMQILVNGA